MNFDKGATDLNRDTVRNRKKEYLSKPHFNRPTVVFKYFYVSNGGCPIHPNRYGSFTVNASRYTGNLINHLSIDGDAYRKTICKTLRIFRNRLESNDSSQLKSTRHTRSRFARHLENIPQVATKWGRRCCRIERLVTLEVDLLDTSESTKGRWNCCRIDSSQLMPTRANHVDSSTLYTPI